MLAHQTHLASYSAYPSAALRSSTVMGFWWAHSVHSELQAASSWAGSREILQTAPVRAASSHLRHTHPKVRG